MESSRRAQARRGGETKALLEWYERRQRDLPWRGVDDPYQIWVSEVMLQQTRVKVVIPYFEAFVERFPSVEALASASIDEVLARWSGLGYYRRARQLHQAARQVVEEGEGIPTTAGELSRLPGIGSYTAAAVASIAFGEAIPALDGNVERVLCRILALAENPKRRALRELLLARAAEILDRERPGDSNQALMEIGATVCLPRGPRCAACPLASGCLAYERGDPESYPPPRKKRAVERIDWTVALVERRGRALFFRRSRDNDLLPGMWELPNVPRQKRLGRSEEALAEVYGGGWRLEETSIEVRHAVTYRSLRLHVHRASLVIEGGIGEGEEAAWISPDELSGFGVSSMFEKVLRACG